MGAFSPSSKVKTQYKAVYIEKNVGTRSTRVLTHMVIKEVKSEVGRAKPFFHFTCPSDRYFADFGCPNTKSTHPKKKKLPKQIGCGWLRCHDENRWMMNRQYPKKAGKFLIPCLLKSKDTRLFVLLFSRIWRATFLVCLRLSLIPFLTLDFPEVEETHRVLLSEHHGFRAIFSKNKRAKDI